MSDIEIYRVPEDRNYWLVRSKGGSLFDHFISNGIVAISHMDKLLMNYPKGDLSYNSSSKKFFDVIINQTFPKETKNAKQTMHKRQVITFLSEMKLGDWVVTLAGDKCRVGVIASEAYISTSPLISLRYPELTEDSSFIRRNIEWGPQLSRQLLSSKINQSLRAQQTIVSLNTHLVDLHHYLFPLFVYADKVFVSVNIGLSADIPLESMTHLFQAANEFSLQVVEGGACPATVKAYFFSEGQVRLTTVAIGLTAMFTALTAGNFFISSTINGNEVTGVRPLSETIERTKKLTESFSNDLNTNSPYPDTKALRSYDKGDNLIDLEEMKNNLPPLMFET